jgi:hypothetical protein
MNDLPLPSHAEESCSSPARAGEGVVARMDTGSGVVHPPAALPHGREGSEPSRHSDVT